MVGQGVAVRSGFALRAVVLTAAVLFAAVAQAGVIRHDREDQDYRDLANQTEYQAVGMVRSAVGGSSRLCSGTLIAPTWVLTAAHCLADTTADTVFYRSQGQSLFASRIIVHPQFTGSAAVGYDVGLVELSNPSDLFTPAPRMRELIPLGATATIVGFGLTGDGLTGSIVGTHGTKRAGQNVVDTNGSRVFDENERPYPEYFLFTDFDNPTDSSDSRWGSSIPLDLEYQTAGGDSGGGWFVSNAGRERLYAVHSIGLSFDETLDNDYGDAAGGTRVTRFNSWIDQQLVDTYWMNPAGGAYADAENWSSTTTPPTNAGLRFAFPQNYAVDLSGDQQAARWTLEYGDVDFELNAGNLQLGELNIANGATANLSVAATHAMQLTGNLTGAGQAAKSGAGELQFTGESDFDGNLSIDEGRFTLGDGAKLTTASLQGGIAGPVDVQLGANALLHAESPLALGANVSVTAADGGTLHAPSLAQDGTLDLANGQVVVDGALVQSATAITAIDVSSLLSFGAGTPITLGAASELGGALRLSLTGVSAIVDVQELTLITVTGTLSGVFSSVEWTALPAGFEFSLIYDEQAVRLKLQGLPQVLLLQPGDTNGDQVVDLRDLNNVRDNFAATTGLGDANGDDAIDLADVNVVRNHFGESRLRNTTATPEPSTIMLATVGILFWIARRRKTSVGC